MNGLINDSFLDQLLINLLNKGLNNAVLNIKVVMPIMIQWRFDISETASHLSLGENVF